MGPEEKGEGQGQILHKSPMWVQLNDNSLQIPTLTYSTRLDGQPYTQSARVDILLMWRTLCSYTFRIRRGFVGVPVSVQLQRSTTINPYVCQNSQSMQFPTLTELLTL